MKKRNPAVENQDPVVRLKPILRVTPRQYVGFAFAAGALALLFALLVLPGIVNAGALVNFTSVPDGAAVYVDGHYEGATPLTAFVRRGARRIGLSKPFFVQDAAQVTVPGRLIAGLVFPTRMSIHRDLRLESAAELLNEAHRAFARGNLAGDPSPRNRLPFVLSEAAADLAGHAGGELSAMLSSAARSVDSGEGLSDWTRAVVVGSGSAAATPFSLLRAAEFVSELWTENPLLPARLNEVLPASIPRPDVPALPAVGAPRRTAAVERRIILGMDFIKVPAASAFYLMASEVTEAEFGAFVAANPAWSPAARAQLVEAGLVDENYLSGATLGGSDGRLPVVNVSHAAALAFCGWLEARDRRFRFYLPTEAEWETAAGLDGAEIVEPEGRTRLSVDQLKLGAMGFRGLMGNVWEWTGDWYYPSGALLPNVRAEYPAAERSVRGGSWLNGGMDYRTRGSQPPEWCTEYLGFRVAAAVR